MVPRIPVQAGCCFFVLVGAFRCLADVAKDCGGVYCNFYDDHDVGVEGGYVVEVNFCGFEGVCNEATFDR